MSPSVNASQRRVLWIIPAVYFLFVASEFVALTDISFTLTARGHSAFEVGLVASAFWIGILLSSLAAHTVVRRMGYARTFVASCAVAAAAVASLWLHTLYVGWMAGVLVLGMAGGLVWVVGEAWLAEVAPADKRGFYVGLFETSVGLGMVTGPAVIPLAQAIGASATGIAAVLMVACWLAAMALRASPGGATVHDSEAPNEHAPQAPRTPSWRQVALPLATVAALSGLLESGSSALLPSVSLRVGFAVGAAAALGALIGAGSALLQAPFGVLADRIGLHRAMALAWALIVITTLVFVVGASHPQQVLWGVGFVLGGVGGAVYTLVVIELGHRLAGPDLVKAMALLVTAYTGGTTLGPSLGGALFDAAGLQGLAAALLVCGVAGSAAAWRASRHNARAEAAASAMGPATKATPP